MRVCAVGILKCSICKRQWVAKITTCITGKYKVLAHSSNHEDYQYSVPSSHFHRTASTASSCNHQRCHPITQEIRTQGIRTQEIRTQEIRTQEIRQTVLLTWFRYLQRCECTATCRRSAHTPVWCPACPLQIETPWSGSGSCPWSQHPGSKYRIKPVRPVLYRIGFFTLSSQKHIQEVSYTCMALWSLSAK